MAREVNQEDVDMDMTPMIDVVFLLIIFFILMPPKKTEGKLESYLPQEGGGPPPPVKEVKFYMTVEKSMNKATNPSITVDGVSKTVPGDYVEVLIKFNNREIAYVGEAAKERLITINPLYMEHLERIIQGQSGLPQYESMGITKTKAEADKSLIIKHAIGYDKEWFSPDNSKIFKKLRKAMIEASKGHEKGRDADVMIDANSEVPFKVILGLLNVGTAAKFPNLKFAAPRRNIMKTK